MGINERKLDKIRKLCSKHKVARLFLFGSVLTKDFSDSSDIDFVVDFQGVELYDYAKNYFNLKASLEELLNRKVDLLEDKAIKNPYLQRSINASKQLIYG